MKRVGVLVGFLSLAVGMCLTASWTQADAQEKQKDQPKVKGTLPANWKKLGLTDEQLKKIVESRGEFATKMASLKSQLQALQKEDIAEATKFLTPEQRDLLKKILTEKIPDPKKKEEKKEDKKDSKESALRGVHLNHIATLEALPAHRRWNQATA